MDGQKIWEIWDFLGAKYGVNMGIFGVFCKKIWEIWEF